MKTPQVSMWQISSRSSFPDRSPEFLHECELMQETVERGWRVGAGEDDEGPMLHSQSWKKNTHSKEHNCHREHKWPETTLRLGRGQRHQTPLWSLSVMMTIAAVWLWGMAIGGYFINAFKNAGCKNEGCLMPPCHLWDASLILGGSSSHNAHCLLPNSLLPKCPNEKTP